VPFFFQLAFLVMNYESPFWHSKSVFLFMFLLSYSMVTDSPGRDWVATYFFSLICGRTEEIS
jgi:hypothetical protein